MKKSYNSDDINQKHGNELSKKLYRTITELSKRLDDARSCARNIEDLFSPSLQIQRRKFCEYCERLIFSDPVLYGRKGEELLWRKGYYDVVSTAKLLKKKQYSLEETANLQSHLNSGVGFYHHMISKLQCAFSLNMHNVIDFPICENGVNDNSSTKENGADWAAQAIHQCLIYLGDLSRYKLEIHPNLEPTLAVHYYMQAIWYKPNQGMPHNQMGTLAMNQNCSLDAVYHYMRCLACKYSFEGTTNNLISLFERNSKYIEQMPQDNENTDSVMHSKSDHIKNFLARFLLLIDIWYFDKTVSKVYNLCHQTFKDLEECLMYNKPTSESGDTPIDLESFESDSTNSLAYLSNDVLFKVSVICLLCITKLQSLHSLQAVSTVSAFTLAVYSHLVQNVITQVQLSILNYPLVEVEATNTVTKTRNKKKNKANLRRRKFLNNESEESESSEDENNSGSSSDDSFMSDKEDVLAESSDDETDIIGSELVNGISTMNGKCSKENEDATILINGNTEEVDDNKQKEEALRKMKKMDVSDMLEIISEQGLLQSIKILNDWLIQDASLLKSCGTNTRSLLRQITYLLNLINININNYKPTSIINLSNTGNIPLHEDVALRGLDILSKSQKNLDWDCMRKISLSIKEETIIRISKLMSFGKYLTTIPETGVSYDETENVFVCSDNDVDERKLSPIVIEELELQDGDHGPVMNGMTKDGAGNSKGQLIKMKHMGQLWLASEVRALENRVRGKSSLSPYLVLDADALIKYTFMVKHLVHSRKFIVLVPSAVVSALDDLKRENPEARDAIRWLESQFHRGNRFFRSQRPQEKASIPFIKYPKKKDKEMFIYIQIIECCYYLAEQQKGATNLVTLLIGNQNLLSNGENREFSYVGLAQTAGVCIESITQFYGKWKKTTKENR